MCSWTLEGYTFRLWRLWKAKRAMVAGLYRYVAAKLRGAGMRSNEKCRKLAAFHRRDISFFFSSLWAVFIRQNPNYCLYRYQATTSTGSRVVVRNKQKQKTLLRTFQFWMAERAEARPLVRKAQAKSPHVRRLDARHDGGWWICGGRMVRFLTKTISCFYKISCGSLTFSKYWSVRA